MTEINTVISSELDYKKSAFSYPLYHHSKLLPQSGTQNLTVSNAGGAETIIEIPNKVYNLSESYLYFNQVPSVPGGTGFGWQAADVMGSIRQVQLYTRGGLFLADINNFDNYTKAIWKSDIELEDLLTFDRMTSGASGAAAGFGAGNGLRANNELAATYNASFGIGPRYDDTVAEVNYLETQYLQRGVTGGNGPILTYRFNMGMIKNSIFSLNKDIFFDEVIVLRIVWNAPSKYLWHSTALDDPIAGHTAYGGSVSMTNITFYLAVETNQDIVQQVISQKNTPNGISMLVPFIYTNKFNLTGNASISLRFNRAHGMKLLKVYYQAISGTESTFTAYEASNIRGARINNFYTLLNNNRLQEFNVDCTTLEDWMVLKSKLKGSLLMDGDVYQYNWVWFDDFSGDPAPLCENRYGDQDNLIRGLDLSSEQKWDIFVTLANAVSGQAFNHYTFAITQKMLIVNSAGIQLM